MLYSSFGQIASIFFYIMLGGALIVFLISGVKGLVEKIKTHKKIKRDGCVTIEKDKDVK